MEEFTSQIIQKLFVCFYKIHVRKPQLKFRTVGGMAVHKG